MLLKEKIALVMGSTNNIGLKIAETFAREGAMVIINSRNADEAAQVAKKISGDSFAADIAKPDDLKALFAHIKNNHQRLDILVNSVAHTSKNDLLQTSLDEWNRIFAVNLTGFFLCIQHAAPLMKDKGGAIINISAASGERASPGSAAYSVSKGAINALTRQAAIDLAPYQIRVNSIISGLVGTPIGKREMGKRKPENAAVPLRRIGRPEEVAEAALFLVSEKADYITNVILPVDGGRMNTMNRAPST